MSSSHFASSLIAASSLSSRRMRLSQRTMSAVVKKRAARPACTAAVPMAMAMWVLPLPVGPWSTNPSAASRNASDMRSSGA